MAAKAMTEMRGPATEEGNTVQLVVFTLGGEEYGVGILDVREIVRAGKITIIPNSPVFVRGVINLRSKIVGVIDLEKRFMLQREGEHTSKHIVITETGDGTFGLLVDEVTDVLRLPEEDIRLPPEIITKKMGIEYVKGVGTLEDKLITLLDLEKVLSEKELIELSKLSRREYPEAQPKKKQKETRKREAPKEKVSKE